MTKTLIDTKQLHNALGPHVLARHGNAVRYGNRAAAQKSADRVSAQYGPKITGSVYKSPTSGVHFVKIDEAL